LRFILFDFVCLLAVFVGADLFVFWCFWFTVRGCWVHICLFWICLFWFCLCGIGVCLPCRELVFGVCLLNWLCGICVLTCGIDYLVVTLWKFVVYLRFYLRFNSVASLLVMIWDFMFAWFNCWCVVLFCLLW